MRRWSDICRLECLFGSDRINLGKDRLRVELLLTHRVFVLLWSEGAEAPLLLCPVVTRTSNQPFKEVSRVSCIYVATILMLLCADRHWFCGLLFLCLLGFSLNLLLLREVYLVGKVAGRIVITRLTRIGLFLQV